VTAVFVTATGTDVGKTFVTVGLARHFRTSGLSVAALKPVVSGFDPAAAAASDPGLLLGALGCPATAGEIDRIAPFRFAAPLSPDLAARREGRTLDFDAVVAFSRRAIGEPTDVVLIEGVGGIMVPLDDRHTVLDWMTALRVPLILTAGSYLGAISHTLTCLDVLQRRELAVAAIVVNESAGSTVALDDTANSIVRFAGSLPVVVLPRLPAATCEIEHPAFARIAGLVSS
jgi:dethiobiotin synthetase